VGRLDRFESETEADRSRQPRPASSESQRSQNTQSGEAQACGRYHAEAKGATSFLCDPDAILTRQGAIKCVAAYRPIDACHSINQGDDSSPTHPPTCSVHEALDRINADVTVPCAHVAGGEERVQLAVALTHKLRRTGYDVMEEAEGFARALHNECACSTQMNGCRPQRSVHRLAGWLTPAPNPILHLQKQQQGASAPRPARRARSSSSRAWTGPCTSRGAAGWRSC